MAVDCVFLSYDEPGADSNYAILNQFFSNPKRLHGVRGMGRAYKMTAGMVDTDWYYIVDGDCALVPEFRPVTEVKPSAKADLYVWQAQNPINDLVYGYGGPKLVRRSAMAALKADSNLDVLSAIPRIEFIPEVAAVTRFNTSPFATWRAAFRECCMLTAGSEYGMPDEFARTRLSAWTAKGADRTFGSWALHGARDGIAFAEQHRNDPDRLKMINDPSQMRAHFVSLGYVETGVGRRYMEKSVASDRNDGITPVTRTLI